MKEINYDFNGLEYAVYIGVDQVFERIKAMMTCLTYGETYFHFVGHPDARWNELGMPDRARKEIVPLKKNKNIKTIGLYFPTEWLVEKFGRDKAVEEKREMRFLPEGLLFPVRFYCYGDVVYYLFEDNQDFGSVEVSGVDFAQWHRDLVTSDMACANSFSKQRAKLTISGFPNSFYPQVAVCSYVLLDLFMKNVTEVEVNNLKAKDELSDLVNRIHGVELKMK